MIEDHELHVSDAEPDVVQIDLHGYHPHDDDLYEAIKASLQKAHDAGLSKLRIIHGHGFNRSSNHDFRRFVNSNTGYLGQTVRGILRGKELRPWMLAKFDCSHDGSTIVRLRKVAR